jgi:uncharacterized protein (DUF433 family)
MNELIERIICDAKICSGKPCIKGTRIPVHIILDLLAAGEDNQGIKRAYPNITDEDIRACLIYASILANEEAGVVMLNFLLMRIFFLLSLRGIAQWSNPKQSSWQARRVIGIASGCKATPRNDMVCGIVTHSFGELTMTNQEILL